MGVKVLAATCAAAKKAVCGFASAGPEAGSSAMTHEEGGSQTAVISSQAGPSYENTDHGYDVTMTHGVMGVNVISRICGKNA